MLIPAHGFFVTKAEETIREQISHKIWREAKIQAALDSGIRGVRALLAHAYDDTPKLFWRYAEDSLKAYLVRLGVTDFRE